MVQNIKGPIQPWFINGIKVRFIFLTESLVTCIYIISDFVLWETLNWFCNFPRIVLDIIYKFLGLTEYLGLFNVKRNRINIRSRMVNK